MRCAGGSVGGRSALPLCILEILKAYSDEEHPLTSGEIIKKLKADYGLSAARNAVGRNLSLLCELGWDISTYGELVPRGRRPYVVHPFAMVCTNGQYYLIGCYDGRDNLTHYRIDRMTDVEVLDESARPIWSLPAYRDRSFDAALYAQEHHFMFGGEPRTVVLKMSRSCAGDVLDAFGNRASMTPIDDDLMKVRVTAALEGMRFFALQFGNHCEVVSPRKLREQVMEDVRRMAKRYGL